MGRTFTTIILVVLLAPVAGAAGAEAEDAERDLEALRQRIELLQSELADAGKRRSEAQAALRQVELAEQAVRRELAALRERQSEAKARKLELERRSRAQQAQLDRQRGILGKQLRLAYVEGREEWLRLVLSQHDPASLGRQLAYYGYFNRYRSEIIEVIRQQLHELVEISSALAAEVQKLAIFEQEQTQQLAELATAREQRATLVASIDRGIDAAGSEIYDLKQQEEELRDLLNRLASIAAGFPAGDGEPFSAHRGSMAWPAAGRVVRSFGQPKADGRLRWTGVLVEAPAGTDVRAIYNGRVVFSDWLQGMGLLLIVEHGEGYLSLYGHNHDLLKEVGDWVLPGDVIAHVGDSGGQASAALYFEIRKDGTPVNPQPWIR
jgi:septal ring factor EnvC (AmiA/AmiB activator)